MNLVDKYNHVYFTVRNNCVLCSTPLNDALIELPDFPLTEIYIPFKNTIGTGYLDQEFHVCRHCGLGQLKYIIPAELLYSDEYVTRTSSSASAKTAIECFTGFVNHHLPDRTLESIFDIGSNDGYLIRQFSKRSTHLYGNDPVIRSGKEDVNGSTLTQIGDFFENIDFDMIENQIECFLCSHTLEHISDPKLFLLKALNAGNEDTLYFFQFPGLEGMIRDAHFDQIFHQHYNYFSLRSIQYLLTELGGDLIDSQINPYHWNSLMIAFKKKQSAGINRKYTHENNNLLKESYILDQYALFKQSMEITSNRLRCLEQEPIFGYGAALMLPVLDYHLRNGLSCLEAIIDDDPSKIGKYYLNVPVKIIRSKMANNLESAAVILTAINSSEAVRKIIPKMIELNFKHIIIPLNLI